MSRRLSAWLLPFLLAQPAWAATEAERQAWVLATTGPEGSAFGQARADAVSVSRRLMGAGFSVTRRENADPATLRLTDRVAPLVLLYFSGPVTVVDGETWLLSGPEALAAPVEAPADPAATPASATPQGWPLGETVRALREAGAVQVIAVIEACHQPGPGFAPLPAAAADLPVTEATSAGPATGLPGITPTTLPYPQDVVFLLSAEPGQPCATGDAATARLTERFVTALEQPGQDFLTAFDALPGQGWVEARLEHRLPPLVPAQVAGTSAGDLLRSLPPEEATRLGGLWNTVPDNGLQLVPVSATGRAGTGTPGAPGTGIPGTGTAATPAVAAGGETGISLIPVSASARIAARPTPEGLPRPSVIVGEIGITEDQPASGGETTATSLRSMSRTDRLAMREAGAAEFDALVQSGAFDPAPAELVAAIQTELREARCYSGGIDGRWGAGSRGGVTAFFGQRKASVPSTEPDLVLFRALLAGDAVQCPAQVAATPRSSGGTGTAARASGSSSSRPAATGSSTASTAAKPTAPAASGGKKIDASSVGLAIR